MNIHIEVVTEEMLRKHKHTHIKVYRVSKSRLHYLRTTFRVPRKVRFLKYP